MTTKYLLIIAEGEICCTSSFFQIYAGSSPIEAQRLVRLAQIAKTKNWYFSKMDLHETSFLLNIAQSLDVPVYQLNWQYYNVSSFLAYFDSHNQAPTFKQISGNAAYLMKNLDLNFRAEENFKVLQKAEADKRKKPKPVKVRNKAHLLSIEITTSGKTAKQKKCLTN